MPIPYFCGLLQENPVQRHMLWLVVHVDVVGIVRIFDVAFEAFGDSEGRYAGVQWGSLDESVDTIPSRGWF